MGDKADRRKGLRVARDNEREQLQDLGETFAELGRQLGDALANAGFIAAGQGAMGWMLQGDPDKALQALRDMTDRQAAEIADAAERLAVLIRGAL